MSAAGPKRSSIDWIGRLVVAALPLALAACASSPKKSSSQALALPDRDRVHSSALAHAGGRKKSPYAAAQEDLSKRGNYKAGGLYAPGVKDSTPDYIPDVDSIPEPEVVAEARSQFGNRSPYVVLGKSYKVLDSHDDYVETGTASYYGQKFHGRRTSNLEVYDMYAFTAAHKSLPLPSFARVTNLDNGKAVTVRVNDRGPFHDDRVIDLSYAAAVKLGITQRGTGRVEVRALHPGEAPPPMYASAANNPPPAPAAAPAKTPSDKTPSAMDRLVSAMPIASANAGELPPGVRIATGKPTPMNAAPAAAAPVKTTVAAGQDRRRRHAGDGAGDGQARSERLPFRHDAERQVDDRGRIRRLDEIAPGARRHRPAGRAGAGESADQGREARAGEAAARAAETAGQAAEGTAARPGRGREGGEESRQDAAGHRRRRGISAARLLDGNSASGQKIWRLRVGPLQADAAPELAARIVGLGFGQPQRVRD